jgi:hypothetical protein
MEGIFTHYFKADAIDKYLEVAEYDNWQEVAELLEGYPL